MNKVLIFCFTVLLVGCNAVPEKLTVPEQTQLIPYEEVGDMQLTSTMLQARWGGRIAQIENRSDSTVIDVVHFTLTGSGKPIESDQSAGRFRVYMQGFLDPAIYQPGRLITALGELGNKETVAVGDYRLKQPVIYAQELHLWPAVKEKETEFVYVPYVIRSPVYIPR